LNYYYHEAAQFQVARVFAPYAESITDL